MNRLKYPLFVIAILFCNKILFAQKKQPNIVFILTDDQRYNTIRALGNDEIETPNLDRLVKNGIAYTQATIMGGKQGAICAPSRAMIMTGRYLHSLPGDGEKIPETDITLPMLLKKNGYYTFATGKWHNDKQSFNLSFDSCANEFFGGMHDPDKGGHLLPSLHNYDRNGIYSSSSAWQGNRFSSLYFADAAVNFIHSRKGNDQPFLCYVAFTAPHDPRTPPKEFKGKYPVEKVSLPRNYLSQHPFNNGEMKIRDEVLLPFPRLKDSIRSELAKYYAMISEVDNQIGRIINALEESDELKNTLIILAGDNGLAVGAHGLLGKQNLYEESVRVPLIISGPGIPTNQKREAFVYLSDIFPTICDYLQLNKPPNIEGKSFVKSFSNKKYSAYDTQYFAYKDIQRATRTKDGWKYIRYYVDNQLTEQLFNLNKDPYEISNLSGDRNYQQQLKKFRETMQKEALKYNDHAAIVNISNKSIF